MLLIVWYADPRNESIGLGQVSQIYAEGIATGFATFEQEIPSYQNWNQAHLKQCRLVVEESNNILGWAALSPVSSRCVYGGIGEVSVYISAKNQGKGIGKLLLQRLITESEMPDCGPFNLAFFLRTKPASIFMKK